MADTGLGAGLLYVILSFVFIPHERITPNFLLRRKVTHHISFKPHANNIPS